jgi:cation transporter-like permease
MTGLSPAPRMRMTRALGATADDGGAAPGAAGSALAALDSEFGGRPSSVSSCEAEDEQKHAKTYKQFLITWSVIFPLTIFVPWVLHPLFQTVPFLGLPGISNLLISAMIVGLLTYVIMPRYTRTVATWLYR